MDVAKLDKQRRKALEVRDARSYRALCNSAGVEPEDPVLYEQGGIGVEDRTSKVEGLRRFLFEANDIPYDVQDVQSLLRRAILLTEHCSGRYGTKPVELRKRLGDERLIGHFESEKVMARKYLRRA